MRVTIIIEDSTNPDKVAVWLKASNEEMQIMAAPVVNGVLAWAAKATDDLTGMLGDKLRQQAVSSVTPEEIREHLATTTLRDLQQYQRNNSSPNQSSQEG